MRKLDLLTMYDIYCVDQLYIVHFSFRKSSFNTTMATKYEFVAWHLVQKPILCFRPVKWVSGLPLPNVRHFL